MGRPYIGVTGFMTPQEVRAALRCFNGIYGRMLMIGVLVSSKTLAGQTNQYPNRYPKVERISEIFQDHPSVLNLVHYATEVPHRLANQLLALVDVAGPYLDGFQLNVAWPPPSEIEEFHRKTGREYRIVLQIGKRAVEMCDGRPQEIASRLQEYIDGPPLISDILVDSSGGRGEPFDPEVAVNILKEVRRRRFLVDIGVAGGLSGGTIHLIKKVVKEFPDVNIDAEGKLRDGPHDDLDLFRVNSYLTHALNALGYL